MIGPWPRPTNCQDRLECREISFPVLAELLAPFRSDANRRCKSALRRRSNHSSPSTQDSIQKNFRPAVLQRWRRTSYSSLPDRLLVSSQSSRERLPPEP